MRLGIFNGYKQIGELQINNHALEEMINSKEIEEKYSDKIKKESERLRIMLEEHPIG